MEITRRAGEGWLELTVDGRLDGYWADHLDVGLAETIREGHHRLRLDLSAVTFLSSAGIGVLVKFHKRLAAIRGRLVVWRLSPQVRTVLDVTHLTDILVDTTVADGVETLTTAGAMVVRNGLILQAFEVAPPAPLACRAVASSLERPLTGTFGTALPVACTPGTMALGVGAIGASDAECAGRFGELLAAGGAAVYLPADGNETPDYLAGAGSDAPQIRLQHGLVVDGPFPRLARFEPMTPGTPASIGALADVCLHMARSQAVAMVLIAETDGLVGASLRAAPAGPNGDFFAFPDVRARLSYTAGRAFARSMALVVGVAQREGGPLPADVVRPLGGEHALSGHFHAAAFPFHAFKKGRLDLHDAVNALLESEILGVLHLLNDDRPIVGAGQSGFVRGACWLGPLGAVA